MSWLRIWKDRPFDELTQKFNCFSLEVRDLIFSGIVLCQNSILIAKDEKKRKKNKMYFDMEIEFIKGKFVFLVVWGLDFIEIINVRDQFLFF